MKRTLKLLAVTALVGTMASAVTIATVNGTKISSEEVNEVMMEGTQGRFNTLPPEKQEELAKRIIDGMIAQELVYGDAVKTGVLKSEAYKKELDLVLERIKKQLAAKVWEQQQYDSITVDPKSVKAYFDEHPEEFVEEEKVHARHILVKTESKANELIGQLRHLSGAELQSKFIELAQKESTGPSASKGGDLGFFPQGQMVPVFNDAVFNMKVATITTTPVQSQFGYHIIYLEEKKAGKTLAFEEVKSFIEQRLHLEKFKAHMDKKMKALTNAATITYDK